MLALKNVRLIDGTGAAPVDEAVILINNGLIEAAGKDVQVPCDASVINGNGMTVIPGLSDMHTHFGGSSVFTHSSCGDRNGTYEFSEAREGFLRWGVTTVRTCGDQYKEMLSYRDDERAGKIISPRVIACGPFIQKMDGHPWGTVYMKDPVVAENACVFADEGQSIEEQVDQVAAEGVDFIKVFYAHLNKMDYPNTVPRISREQLERVADSAHRNGLKCACHVDGPEEMMDAAGAGVDFIEHMIGAGNENGTYSEDMLQKIVESKTVVTPTMVSVERFDKTPGFRSVWEELKKAVLAFYKAGVPLMVGCDSGVPFVPFGESLHDEMAYMVEAGIPASEVLQMATLGNMRHMGLDAELGSVEAGKKADLILLGSDPLSDIGNTKDIKLVVKDGRIVYEELN